MEFKEKKKKTHVAKTIFDKVASWPSVRSFNFDVNGNNKIVTNLRAYITIPLLAVILLVSTYIFFPVFYKDAIIKTEVSVRQIKESDLLGGF